MSILFQVKHVRKLNWTFFSPSALFKHHVSSLYWFRLVLIKPQASREGERMRTFRKGKMNENSLKWKERKGEQGGNREREEKTWPKSKPLFHILAPVTGPLKQKPNFKCQLCKYASTKYCCGMHWSVRAIQTQRCERISSLGTCTNTSLGTGQTPAGRNVIVWVSLHTASHIAVSWFSPHSDNEIQVLGVEHWQVQPKGKPQIYFPLE